MKRFTQFINEEYDREKHSKKLDKTTTSLNNHLRRNKYNHDNRRTWELVDRYDDLKSHMVKHDYDGWKKYCKDRGSHTSHGGHDLLA
jgi:hypothetical protein